MQGKRLVSMLLTLTLAFGMTIQVRASSIEETKKKGEALEAQKNTAEEEEAALADQLNTLITEIEQTTAKIEAKGEEIAVKEVELIQAQIDENDQYESMKKRIKYMYENGNTQFIEILFESKSISDLLNNAEYITQISEYDRDMLDEFKAIVKQVDEQKTALEAERAELETLETQLQEKKAEISKLMEEKAEEISRLETAIGENAAKLKALQEEAARQEAARRAALEAAQQTANNNSGGGSGSSTPGASWVSGNGRLSTPCNGYVSSEFGGRNSPGGIGSTNHKGRDYAASYGSGIYAAASGTVTTVVHNYNTSVGRGAYVVINHGNGLSTVYQHCSKIYVSEGQSVSVGQNIAAVGTSGASTGPHLHFEVWVNGVPVDPRNYL